MVREPRIMRSPNGALLNVDVTALQMGLGRCRVVAESAIASPSSHEECAKALAEIVVIVRDTMGVIENNKMIDEVGAVLADGEIYDAVEMDDTKWHEALAVKNEVVEEINEALDKLVDEYKDKEK